MSSDDKSADAPHQASAFWDARFDKAGFHFGTDPAAFLTAQAGHLPDGAAVLSVGDGEGRNSAYLAGLGHRVTAFDFSPVAVDKARGRAAELGLQIDYHRAAVQDWDWTQVFDAVVAIFVQFAAPEMRARMFDGFRQAVRPGGLLLLHGYAPRQVGYGTGGPPDPRHMYTEDMLRDAFAGWQILRLSDYDAEIDEGTGHKGRSALVDLVARKPG
ncbi:SAM-dependent methyltransferase [Actibacterium ureilyticum]|uniref:SAM-dependent methyltransferase n=1 Tax=Actibacterium ureilyticum TaxID=1590614 RepID=UPI000BAAA592|nr:class I SAM-dependent methyltransferase [Actibacterium ureilyticum]